jgi:hypothetical protein
MQLVTMMTLNAITLIITFSVVSMHIKEYDNIT